MACRGGAMTDGGTPLFLRPFEALGARLRESDVPQLAALCLAALIVVLALAWPGRAGTANEAWSMVAQARSLIVALLALSYGALSALTVARRAILNAAAVMMVAMSLLPIELVAHAGSVPSTPAWWAWLSTPVAVAGQLAIGCLAAKGMQRLRLPSLVPLLPLLLVAAFIALDVRFDFTALNPLGAALSVSPLYLTVMGVAGAIGLLLLALPRRPGGKPAA